MRDLNFRAFINDEMVILPFAALQYFDFEGSYVLSFAVDGYDEFWAHEHYEKATEMECKNAPIMQYTGLKDKNGVDIYEGDILKGFQKQQQDKEGKNGFAITDTVYWQGGGFKLFGKNMQSGYTKDNNVLYQFMWCDAGRVNSNDHYYQIDDIEVIGNIHQNKELLTPAQEQL